MLVLTEVAGLPLIFSREQEHLLYDKEQVQCDYTKAVSLMEIIPSLLNKSLRYPEQIYSQHMRMLKTIDVSAWPINYKYDVIHIPAGLLGIEYVRSHIFHINSAYASVACVVHILEGKLTVVLQRNREKNDPFELNISVAEAFIVDLEAGDKAVIPAGYYYTFANTEEAPVVFARVVGVEHIVNYQTLKRENGLAYYIISKNARREIVSNPRYRDVGDVRHVSKSDLNARFGYINDHQTPLYVEVKQGSPIFAEMAV